MRDIKERVRIRIRRFEIRLPGFRKNWFVRLYWKQKKSQGNYVKKSSGQSDSPTQYGTEKIESVQYRAASVAGKTIGKTTYQGGKKTCRSDLSEDKGKKKQTGRSESR